YLDRSNSIQLLNSSHNGSSMQVIMPPSALKKLPIPSRTSLLNTTFPIISLLTPYLQVPMESGNISLQGQDLFRLGQAGHEIRVRQRRRCPVPSIDYPDSAFAQYYKDWTQHLQRHLRLLPLPRAREVCLSISEYRIE